MKKIYSTLVALLATANMFAQGWPANYSGVMLQGFSWDSYDYSQWSILEKQADDMKGFIDLVWLPQSGKCIEATQVMGYLDSTCFKNKRILDFMVLFVHRFCFYDFVCFQIP